VTKFLKNTPFLLTILGMAIMAQSILWEYVRVRPTYRFIVEPWSQRGYEVNQGLVLASGAVLVIVLTSLMVSGVIKETRLHSLAAVAIIIVFAVGAAVLVDAKDVKIPFIVHVILSAIGGIVLRSLLEGFIPEEWSKRRRLTRFGLWLVGFLVALFAVVGPLLNGEQPFWIFLAVSGAVLGALSLFQPPTTLGNWRMIINTVLGLWIMSMTMSAALRHGLAGAQFIATDGLNADAQDLQITSGVILAWLGGLLAFTGSVGLWARRRDEIAALDRARKQQAAARESEAQLSVTG
jgi:hypothetical protein